MQSFAEMPVNTAQSGAQPDTRVSCGPSGPSEANATNAGSEDALNISAFDSKAATHECPCCGNLLKNQRIHVDLDTNRFVFGSLSIRLQPQKIELMKILVDCHPRTASHDFIASRLFGLIEPKDARNSIKVHVFQLRRLLAGFDVWIRNIPHVGYRLDIIKERFNR